MSINESRLPKAIQSELAVLRARVAELEGRYSAEAKSALILADRYDAVYPIPDRTVSFLLAENDNRLATYLDVDLRLSPLESKRGNGCVYVSSAGGHLRITPHVSNAVSIEVVR